MSYYTELKSGSSGDVSSTNTASLVAAGTQTDVQTEIGDLAASEQSVVAGHGGRTPKRPRLALPAKLWSLHPPPLPPSQSARTYSHNNAQNTIITTVDIAQKSVR